MSNDNKVLNQDSAHITITDPKKKKDYSKGVLMLGNKKVTMPNGEYVLASEIKKALQDYVMLNPGKKPVIPSTDPIKTTPNDPKVEKEKVYRVIKRITKKMSIILIIIALMATLMSGFEITDDFSKQQVITESISAVYDASLEDQADPVEVARQAIEKLKSAKTGDSVHMSSGVEYGESSDCKYGGANNTGKFGSELRKEGNYNLDYISILNNGQIINVEYKEGQEISKIMEQAAKKLNVLIDKLEPVIHVGGPVSGWVSYNDLCKKIEDNSKSVSAQLEKKEDYKGIVENFTGDSITLDNGATIKIKDANGNLLRNGSTVVGSDGEKYRITNLELQTEKTVEQEMIKTGSHLTWSLHNVSKELAFLAGTLAIAATLASKKERKEMTDMTGNEIEKLVDDAKAKFDSESEFSKAVETLTLKKIDLNVTDTLEQALIGQELPTTVEEIENMGGKQK